MLAPSAPAGPPGVFGTAAGAQWNAAPPRTPTPPPSLVPPTPAPAAPVFRPPPTPVPSFVHQAPTQQRGSPPPPPSGSGGQHRAWIAIAVAGLVLVAALAVLVVLLLKDDDPTTPQSSPTTSPPVTPSETAPRPRPDAQRDRVRAVGPGDVAGPGGRLHAARADGRRQPGGGVRADETIGPGGGRCIAESIVREVGVDALVEAGVLDSDLNVDESTQVEDTALGDSILSATFACFSEIGS